jgi:hypothetical protein
MVGESKGPADKLGCYWDVTDSPVRCSFMWRWISKRCDVTYYTSVKIWSSEGITLPRLCSDALDGFRLEIGFIEHLQTVTNDYGLSLLHSLQMTTAHT